MNRLLWLFLIVTRLRDRLRCPKCKAVGTYKLHAPSLGEETEPPWRWLCKYCGYYRDKNGKRWCVPSPTFGCWIFKDQKEGYKGKTPLETVRDGSVADYQTACLTADLEELKPGYTVWPWRG